MIYLYILLLNLIILGDKMNKITKLLTKIFMVIFIIGTTISCFIVYNHVEGDAAFIFVLGYVIFVFVWLFYMFIIAILNSRKLKSSDIKRRIIRFIIWSVLFSVINFIFDYIFRQSSVDLLRECSIGVSMAFGISFIDIALLKKEGY